MQRHLSISETWMLYNVEKWVNLFRNCIQFHWFAYFPNVLDETVRRGCAKDLSDSDFDACRKMEHCKICTDDSCNTETAGSSGRVTANVAVIAVIACIIFLFKIHWFHNIWSLLSIHSVSKPKIPDKYLFYKIFFYE